MVWNTSKKIAYFPPRGLIHNGEIKLTPIPCNSTISLFFRRYFPSILIFSLASCTLTPSLPEKEMGLNQVQDKENKESTLYEKKEEIPKADQTKSFEGDELLDLVEEGGQHRLWHVPP